MSKTNKQDSIDLLSKMIVEFSSNPNDVKKCMTRTELDEYLKEWDKEHS